MKLKFTKMHGAGSDLVDLQGETGISASADAAPPTGSSTSSDNPGETTP